MRLREMKCLPKVTQLGGVRVSSHGGLSEFSEKGGFRKLSGLPINPKPWLHLSVWQRTTDFLWQSSACVLIASKVLGGCPACSSGSTRRKLVLEVFCLRGCLCLNTESLLSSSEPSVASDILAAVWILWSTPFVYLHISIIVVTWSTKILLSYLTGNSSFNTHGYAVEMLSL